MRVLVQWTLQNPQDWVEIDLDDQGLNRRSWRNLPSRPEPDPGQLGGTDDIPGWVFDLNVQGVHFGGYDHYACDLVPAGISVTVWNDDPIDWPPGTRTAQVWSFLAPAFDARFGEINTRQSRVVYTETPERYQVDERTLAVNPWADFVLPASNITRHGIWCTDEKVAEHTAARQLHGWREWVV